MPAYTIDLKLSCDYGDCEKRAVVAVFNRFNEERGRYCRRHGQWKLDELLAGEKPLAPLATGQPLRVDSVGSCSRCGYEGPGPAHDCKPEARGAE